jgi:hypothetical protein
VFDILFNNTTDIQPEIHSTDTHGSNALVLSWPEITNIAQSTRETAHVQGELI